jgi:TP901 family phage tail tape measure protein
MTDVGVAYVRIVPSMKGFSSEVDKELGRGLTKPATDAGRKTGDGFVTGFGNALQSGGKTISSAGDKLTMGLTLPLLGLGVVSLSASRDFNSGMANIGTLIPGNTDRVNELGEGIRGLAIDMGSTTGDLTDGAYQIVSAFGDTSESLSLLEINAKAAKAGMASTTDAINLTSAVTKGYGDTSAEAVQKAADLGLLTVRLGQTEFPALAASIGQVIPIASELGVTQEELFASMATFTGVTGGASEVATQMRAAMQGLMAPTSDAQKAIEDAGFASGAAAIEELGLAGAVGILTDAAESTGEPLQKFLGQVEGQVFALGLAGSQAETYEQKLAEMSDAAGTTDEAHREMTEGVNAAGFQWDQAKSQANDMAIELGNALAPAMADVLTEAQPLITGLADLITKFSDADPETQKMILGAVGLVVALGPVLSIVGRVTTAVGGLVKGAAAFGRGTAAMAKGGAKLATGIGRIAVLAARGVLALGRLALAAGRAGLAVVKAGAQMIAAAAKATARVVASIATQIARWFVLGVQALLHAAKVALAWLISLGPIGLIAAAIIAIAALVILHFDTVRRWVLIAFNAVRGAVLGVFDWIKANWPLLLGILTGPIGLAVVMVIKHWDTIMAGFTAVRDWIAARIEEIVGFLVALPGRVWSFITTLYDAWMAATTAVRDWIAARITDIVNFIIGLPGRVWSFITGLYEDWKTATTEVKDWIGNRVDDIVGFFTGLPGRISSAVSSIARKLKKPFVDAVNAIRKKWNDTVGGFGFSIPSWVPGVGGNSFKIPSMHTGGIVPGVPGTEQLIMAQAGEVVLSRSQRADLTASDARVGPGMAPTVVVRFADPNLRRWLAHMVRTEYHGDVNAALSGR